MNETTRDSLDNIMCAHLLDSLQTEHLTPPCTHTLCSRTYCNDGGNCAYNIDIPLYCRSNTESVSRVKTVICNLQCGNSSRNQEFLNRTILLVPQKRKKSLKFPGPPLYPRAGAQTPFFVPLKMFKFLRYPTRVILQLRSFIL